jgi:hypothetical protein
MALCSVRWQLQRMLGKAFHTYVLSTCNMDVNTKKENVTKRDIEEYIFSENLKSEKVNI